MTTVADIGWGSYKQFEGPYFKGTLKYTLPENPSDNHKFLAVVTTTEGGCYDAINMYDQCIVSTGLLQWCESKYYLTSNLLGAIAEKDPQLLAPISEVLRDSHAEFKRTSVNTWRFFNAGAVAPVASTMSQQAIFLGCTGAKGGWGSKDRALHWAASLATLLAQPEAMAVQVDYTAERLMMFCTSYAREVLFGDDINEGWVGAARAIYLSFAANNPAMAAAQLKRVVDNSKEPKWCSDWCVELFRALTFGPGVAIYPHRYEVIRPVVETLYGVNLPDHSSDLAGPGPKEVQAKLIELGYDLGPGGADGKLGPRTKSAVKEFQTQHGLTPDGVLSTQVMGLLFS